jgi:hypothetical protein
MGLGSSNLNVDSTPQQAGITQKPVTAPSPTSTGQNTNAEGDTPFVLSNCTGRKKALLIGIEYVGQGHWERPCQVGSKDARRMASFLQRYGFKPENSRLLIKDTRTAQHQPTRMNILSGMEWLVDDAQPNDSLFLFYSGHGSQVVDRDGDEVDGKDEAICSLDSKSAGLITDDELHRTLHVSSSISS